MWLPLILYSILCLIQFSKQQQQFSNNEFLLVANNTAIYKFNEISYKTSLITHLPEDYDVAAVDYSLKERLLFWLSRLDYSINVHNLETGERIFSLENQESKTEHFAVDWITKKVYSIEDEPYRILVFDYNGANSSIILLLPSHRQPKCIALAPLSGLLFWSDLDSINRISMNGDPTTIKQITNTTHANALSIDHSLKKIYWTDAIEKKIRCTDFNGRYFREIQSAISASIAFHNGNVYYSDLILKTVYSFNAIGRKQRRLIAFDDVPPLLNYVSAQNQPDHPSNQCSLNNGGCSNLCLLSSESPYFSCACPSNLPLSEDGKTCKQFPDEFLLVAFPKQIKYIPLNTNDFLPKPTKIDQQDIIKAIDFDPVDQRVYWINGNQVKSAFLNGTDEKLITECELEYERLRVDSQNRNIYLVKFSIDVLKRPERYESRFSSNFSVEVVSIDGRFKKTLINTFINSPKAISIDYRSQFFYWSDWGKDAKIEKVSFDLKVRKQIVNKEIFWPNAIVLDYESNRLYWCDAKLHRIEFTDLDGQLRGTLVDLSSLNVLLIDLTLLGEYIYWVDSLSDQIGRVHKLTGEYEMISNKNQKLQKIMSLHAVSNRIQIFKNEQLNHCSQLRLSANLCSCSDGFVLQNDNITCLPGNNTCELNNDCEQNCFQIVGDYHKCFCNEGFYLKDDQKSCQLISIVLPLSACNDVSTSCSHSCYLINHKPHCSCPSGMYLHRDGRTCLKSIDKSTESESKIETISSPTANHQNEISLLIVALLSFVVITVSVFSIVRYFAIRKRKDVRKFENSTERIIVNRIDLGDSLLTVGNSVLYERNPGVGASATGEHNSHNSLIDPPPSPTATDHMSSISKCLYEIPRSEQTDTRLNFDTCKDDESASLIWNTDFRMNKPKDNYSHTFDCDSNLDPSILVPPPTPQLCNSLVDLRNDETSDDHRIFNIQNTAKSNDEPPAHSSTDLMNFQSCNLPMESETIINPPNSPFSSPTSSTNNLHNF